MPTDSSMYLVQQVSASFRGNATLVDTSGATLVQFALDYCKFLGPSYDLSSQNLIIRQLLIDAKSPGSGRQVLWRCVNREGVLRIRQHC